MFPLQASLGAGGAYNNARLVSEEVQKTLREVQGLLAKTSTYTFYLTHTLGF